MQGLGDGWDHRIHGQMQGEWEMGGTTGCMMGEESREGRRKDGYRVQERRGKTHYTLCIIHHVYNTPLSKSSPYSVTGAHVRTKVTAVSGHWSYSRSCIQNTPLKNTVLIIN